MLRTFESYKTFSELISFCRASFCRVSLIFFPLIQIFVDTRRPARTEGGLYYSRKRPLKTAQPFLSLKKWDNFKVELFQTRVSPPRLPRLLFGLERKWVEGGAEAKTCMGGIEGSGRLSKLTRHAIWGHKFSRYFTFMAAFLLFLLHDQSKYWDYARRESKDGKKNLFHEEYVELRGM